MSFYFAFKPAGINRALGTKLRSPYHIEKKYYLRLFAGGDYGRRCKLSGDWLYFSPRSGHRV